MEQTADIYIKDKKSRFIEASKALAQMHGFKDRRPRRYEDFDLRKNMRNKLMTMNKKLLRLERLWSTRSKGDLARWRCNLG